MLRDIRTNYQRFELNEQDLTPHPFNLFHRWLNEAINQKQEEPTAMTLSTCIDGQPDSRIVLLKELTADGFVFFTNYNSTKGQQIEGNSLVAINFFWSKLERQVRIKGKIVKLDNDQSIKYFKSRPRDSQLGAWASEQSKEIKDREELENRFKAFENQYQNKDIGKPENWGGYLTIPSEIEFWQGRPNRLHDRFRYYFSECIWTVKRLAP